MPRSKAHVVELSAADRDGLTRVVSTGHHPAQMIRRARVLLALDASQGPVADRAVVADKVGMSAESIRLIAKRFVDTGGDVEARLSALACSAPPAGRTRWSMRLLEKHVALIEELPDLDHTTISRVLKKRNFVLI